MPGMVTGTSKSGDGVSGFSLVGLLTGLEVCYLDFMTESSFGMWLLQREPPDTAPSAMYMNGSEGCRPLLRTRPEIVKLGGSM